MMKWTHVCPLLGVALLACATGENQDPEPLGLGSAGSGASSASAGAGANAGASTSGGAATGGSSSAAASTGGTFSFSGTFSLSGSSSFGGSGFGTAGSSTGGAAQAGAAGTAGTSSGAGGKASGGVGGKASGGAGGTASAGAGGGGNAVCTTLPAKSTWKGSASQSDAAYPPAKAFDGDDGTRFSTGTKQVGGEWLQIDFGQTVSVDEITLFTNNDDYFRHYELRLSSTSQDFAAPVIKSADGVTGSIVVPVSPAKDGRYLTIRQTGADTDGDIAWWSLHEVSIACK